MDVIFPLRRGRGVRNGLETWGSGEGVLPEAEEILDLLVLGLRRNILDGDGGSHDSGCR